MLHAVTALQAAADGIRRLQEGNERFLAGTTRSWSHREMLAQLVEHQQPYATLLCCSDSRVPPEIIFDAGLGELFVVRVAGNVISAHGAASLQYAGAHLGTPLFIVMGHEGCGAVKATLDTMISGRAHRKRIQTLVRDILPALGDVDLQLPPEQMLSRAVEANVRWTIRQIQESPEGRANIGAGRVVLVGAIYDLKSGKVRLLS